MLQLVIEEPLFSRLQAHCLAKANAFEDHPWDQVSFKLAPKGKMFCSCMGMVPAVLVKSTLEEQSVLIQHPSIEIAPYLGRHGWVMVYVRTEEELELALDLIDQSYDLLAPKKRASL